MNRWKKEQRKLKADKVCVKDASIKCDQKKGCIMRTSSCPPLKNEVPLC